MHYTDKANLVILDVDRQHFGRCLGVLPPEELQTFFNQIIQARAARHAGEVHAVCFDLISRRLQPTIRSVT